MMTKQEVAAVLARCAGRRVLVVGDLMLDRYVIGRVSRISPEAPVPVVRVTREHAQPGGAANVAQNIQSLGGQAMVVGLVGRDAAGDQLEGLLAGHGIDTRGIVRGERVQTAVKMRIVAERQQVVRVDHESPPGDIPAGCLDELAERMSRLSAEAQAMIIEDYGKGVVTQGVVDRIAAAAAASGVPLGLDPKDNENLKVPHLTLATPNYKEACHAAGIPETDLPDHPADSPTLQAVAAELKRKWNTELLVITLGAHGMYLVPRSGPPRVLPTRAREVFDVSGAGDTVIATAMLALAAGVEGERAAFLANVAAGVVVGKAGTATCSPGELLAAMDEARE